MEHLTAIGGMEGVDTSKEGGNLLCVKGLIRAFSGVDGGVTSII